MNAYPKTPEHQQGAALIVALILLLIMTILGLSSIRTTVMDEKMTAASYDRSLAFQAAEAALRAGEAVALAQSTASPKNSAFPNAGLYTDSDSNCNTSPCNAQGLCAQPDPDCDARWLDSTFNNWANAAKVNDLAGTPQYFVEYLGNNFPCNPEDATSQPNCAQYRITARSIPGANRAQVMLQSTYLTN
ncbi:PilX N-terminal domain-containing pilus assembly protein [Thiofaba sp. EF100]|uniref:pilus assembly PilX family protein n=1 Tax=Thiofaba sp. EF100 TaxID=3121274 RepID=UPI0032221996